MSPLALGLVIGAAVVHAGWNALAKRAGDPLAFLWCAGGVSTLLYLPGVLYVLSATGFPRAALPFVVTTVVLHSAYFFTLGRAYGAGDLSVVYPVARGLGVALVPVLAFAIFDERLSPVGTLGVALVVLGIFSLHGRRRWRAAPLLAPGTGWALATGLIIAGYSLVDKAGVTLLHPLAYIGLLELGAFLVLVPAVRREWRGNRLAILVVGILSPGAYLLVLFAFQLSKVAYVVAGREVSIVLSALIGSLWMREGALSQRLAGAAVVAAGVVCVALAR
ncbi:MAG: EamA family transporter [Candidatus Rokuibacteriota bacterium]|nr:MAG: EamA family transporter [Candidatus Rokubacteria bacterium]